MKILFLTNIPSPYRVDFFNELGKMCELTVLYELNNATDRNKNWMHRKNKYFNAIFLKGIRTTADSALCISVLKYLKDSTYDIIVIGGYSTPTGMLAINYLKLNNKKFILSSDGGIIKNETKLKYNIKRYFIGSAYAWLSTGKKTTEYLLNYGAKKDKIYKYPFTSIRKQDILDSITSRDDKFIIRNKLNIKYEKVIISVGQFIERKGFDILIKAMNLLPRTYGLYIIGGNPTQEYINLKDQYKLDNVHFEDFKAKEELKEYYKLGDLFVLPTREDIWGLVINEAMANGLPIITTDNCVAGLELVKEGINGYIIKVENIEQLANKINLILSNSNNIKSMSRNSLDVIKDKTIEQMAHRHIEIFNNILSQK